MHTLEELLLQLGLGDLDLDGLVNLLLVAALVVGIVLDGGGEERVDEGGLSQSGLASNLKSDPVSTGERADFSRQRYGIAHHNSEGSTALRNDLVSLVREVGNANERRGIGGGHCGGVRRGVSRMLSRQLGRNIRKCWDENQLASTGSMPLEIVVFGTKGCGETWIGRFGSGAVPQGQTGRNFLSPLVQNGMGRGLAPANPTPVGLASTEVGEDMPPGGPWQTGVQ